MNFYKHLELPLDETFPQDISTHLDTMSAQKLSEMRLRDLHLLSQHSHHHGLYFFYQDEQLMYIGTCRSRTFFNRVVCHLDAFEHAWMNTLLRKVKDHQNVSLQEAATTVFEHFSVKFVSVPMFMKEDKERKSQLLHLENALRAELQPKLNAAKSISPGNLYYSAVLATEDAMNDKEQEVALQEEQDIQSEERVLMVNVTKWDDALPLEQNKAQARSAWIVNEAGAKNIGYLAAWHKHEIKEVWVVEDVSHDGERASFTLGEQVTDSFKTQLSTQLNALSDGGYRMYSAVKYLS